MSAYVIVDIDIKDELGYQEYKKLSSSSVEAHGGKFIVRGGRTEPQEGTWIPKRLVIIEFESMHRARTWLTSPEYTIAKAIRHSTADANLVIVEGV
jgi:uncharacterized protein (DUF1330 family)